MICEIQERIPPILNKKKASSKEDALVLWRSSDKRDSNAENKKPTLFAPNTENNVLGIWVEPPIVRKEGASED